MISEETLLGILLKRTCRSVNESHWAELDEILLGSAEHPGPLAEFWREAKDADLTFEHKAARARRAFVGTLVDWMQLHDFHAPFPSGPPSKGQSCAKVENEHSCQEKTYCGKMFPRKLIIPGSEEVAEDPLRRELYRLWLARNCAFMNNFVPVVSLATLANMDFQATTTKTGILE